MLNKYSILGGIVLVTSLVYGSKVQAEGNCPEGYFPIGGQGVQGCAPIPVQQRPRSNPGSGGGRSKPIIRPKVPIDRLTLQEAVTRIETSATDKAQFETLYGKILFNDPQKGLWTMKSQGGGTAKQCGATFFDRPSLSNGLVLLGPNQVGKELSF
jgi:hypothetical protein